MRWPWPRRRSRRGRGRPGRARRSAGPGERRLLRTSTSTADPCSVPGACSQLPIGHESDPARTSAELFSAPIVVICACLAWDPLWSSRRRGLVAVSSSRPRRRALPGRRVRRFAPAWPMRPARAVSIQAVMRPVSGTAKLQIRFDLMRRSKRGAPVPAGSRAAARQLGISQEPPHSASARGMCRSSSIRSSTCRRPPPTASGSLRWIDSSGQAALERGGVERQLLPGRAPGRPSRPLGDGHGAVGSGVTRISRSSPTAA